MENKLGGLWRLVARGISLGPGDIAKPSPLPSVVLYLQFFWKSVQRKRKNDKWKYFGSQTKNKEFRTNILQQTVELSVGSIKHGDALANAQAQLTEHAEIQWRRKSSQGGSLIRSNCLLYLRRQKLFQGKLCAYSALLVPQCWLNKYKEWLAESSKILLKRETSLVKVEMCHDPGIGDSNTGLPRHYVQLHLHSFITTSSCDHTFINTVIYSLVWGNNNAN